MKFLVFILFLILGSVGAEETDKTFFPTAKKDIETVLSNKIFSSYYEYNITNIAQGEIGESMAYFISLEKPFEAKPVRLCFIFLSKGNQDWNLRGSVEKCADKTICSCK